MRAAGQSVRYKRLWPGPTRVTGLWRYVSGMSEKIGTLETCRHKPVTGICPLLNYAGAIQERFTATEGLQDLSFFNSR